MPASSKQVLGKAAARAPGRLDVMGGIGDYSGSLVLQLPLAVATRTTIAWSDESKYFVESEGPGPDGTTRKFSMPADEAREILEDYQTARSYFADHPSDHWASYVMGCLTALRIEEDVEPPSGFSLRVASEVPEGKGVSSSAALEVSVMGSVLRLLGIELAPERIARLCQIVENRVAGAPCGIMDQMTAACGLKDHLLALLCQPAELQGHIRLPREVAVWGIDSGIRHSVGGSDYSTVRTAAAMGYRIIAECEGLPVERIDRGRVRISDDNFDGYLARLGSTRLEAHLPSLPPRMSGAEFLAAYDGITDDTVAVDPDRSYPVRAATTHPVHEHERSERFATLLESGTSEKSLAMMGELMYLSHASYSACGLGSEGTDRIVELVRDEGYRQGLFGARITGGGSGGTVAVLASAASGDAVRRIALKYEAETGRRTTIFEGSSNGLSANLELET